MGTSNYCIVLLDPHGKWVTRWQFIPYCFKELQQMPIMVKYVLLLHVHIYCILVTHCNGFLDFSLGFICMERDCICLGVRSSRPISQTFLFSLTNLIVTRKVSLKNHREKSAICFSVFWESFSLQWFHSFTHVVFNVLWVSCSVIYCIVWHYFLLQKLYKEAYEQSKGTSMNYCDTPKFQTDTVLKNFSDVCIWFMVCHSVLTLLITFAYQLVIVFPGKI